MKNAISSSSRTFVASLHPLAARFNLKPHLSDVTLADLLAGETCAPISLADFENYLTFVEYSVENLQFLVWFQDYRERYLRSPHTQANPAREYVEFGAPNRAQTERRAAESLAKLAEAGKEDFVGLSYLKSPDDAVSPTSSSLMLPPHYTQLTLPPLAFTVSKTNDPGSHMFRTECLRAVATFLSPGATKELPLEAIVRDTAIRNLSLDFHPDVFLPVYEEIYNLLERCSLPRFLAIASANINLPKQIYWYSIGVVNITLGLLIALLLITMLPTPPEANRAWRIFAVGFCSIGTTQCYSAWRGYCSQIWMRGTTQLRVWEMQEMDAEAKAFVDRILRPARDDDPQDEKSGPQDNDVAVIAPFAVEPLTLHAGQGRRPSQSSDTITSYGCATTGISTVSAAHEAQHLFLRPPVFGPEAVVLEPRIKAVHRQVLIEVCHFGTWFLLAFSALIFSVPSRSHR
ncbi:hypothetical protein D9615_000839 [Tricholomella constricta]|uniref:RGS domain-containing protein n=1 Tax=Tricholomella constricta TaxID=117010 RepID=A0A8H5HRG4_9AGAR|nr:hypothetical protein D9615_000839 [Tricholomella constricta]